MRWVEFCSFRFFHRIKSELLVCAWSQFYLSVNCATFSIPTLDFTDHFSKVKIIDGFLISIVVSYTKGNVQAWGFI